MILRLNLLFLLVKNDSAVIVEGAVLKIRDIFPHEKM